MNSVAALVPVPPALVALATTEYGMWLCRPVIAQGVAGTQPVTVIGEPESGVATTLYESTVQPVVGAAKVAETVVPLICEIVGLPGDPAARTPPASMLKFAELLSENAWLS